MNATGIKIKHATVSSISAKITWLETVGGFDYINEETDTLLGAMGYRKKKGGL